MTQKEPLLWLSDARGQYIPRDFAESFADRAKHVTGVDDEQWAILEHGPEGALDSEDGPNERYWEVWAEVCDNAVITDDDGTKFHVHQDGDCWLIPDGMEWSDESEFFVWPQDTDDDNS
jgi:hypothetical protein